MSELGETFEGYRAAKQEKRASNRSQSADYLTQRGIPFSSHNFGAHLIVEGPAGYIDFWPGTGRWKDRRGPAGFGVRNLVIHLAGPGAASEPPAGAHFYPDDFPAPDWVKGSTAGRLCTGAQLCTRDGRRMGNAVICGERRWQKKTLGSAIECQHPVTPPRLAVRPVVTDAGALMLMTDEEIAEAFWPPKWVMDPRTHSGVERLIALGWDLAGYLPGDRPPLP